MRELPDRPEEPEVEECGQYPTGICCRCGVAGVQGNVCEDPTDCAHRIAVAKAGLKPGP